MQTYDSKTVLERDDESVVRSFSLKDSFLCMWTFPILRGQMVFITR